MPIYPLLHVLQECLWRHSSAEIIAVREVNASEALLSTYGALLHLSTYFMLPLNNILPYTTIFEAI